MVPQEGEAVGQKPLGGHQKSQIIGCNPSELGHFPINGLNDPLVSDFVATSDEVHLLIVVDPRPEKAWRSIDSCFLQQFAACRLVVGLAGRDDTTNGDIPPPGPNVFGFTPTMHQHITGPVAHEDKDGSVP